MNYFKGTYINTLIIRTYYDLYCKYQKYTGYVYGGKNNIDGDKSLIDSIMVSLPSLPEFPSFEFLQINLVEILGNIVYSTKQKKLIIGSYNNNIVSKKQDIADEIDYMSCDIIDDN